MPAMGVRVLLPYLFTTFTGLPSINDFRFATAISISRCLLSLGAQAMWGVMKSSWPEAGGCPPLWAP